MPSKRDLANAIRALSMDAVQKANSGHPGAPMGMADIAEVLWNDYLQHNPNNPDWSNRDRFVLSNGHGSMLLYSLLHLTGYGLSIEDIKNFRQLNSPTAGHPEYGHAPGIETTTGPLGQGIANAVGMALAERTLAAQFNRDGHEIVDHYTYAFCGDGCLMEGISHEVCSLAGTQALSKLILFYDDNGISIDGEIEGWFTDDTPKRFESYNWQVIRNVDGHDPVEIKTALDTARAETDRPTLICCRTIIGYGSPNKQGKESSHGAALGEEEVALAREQLGWSHAPFEIPTDIQEGWSATDQGAAVEAEWQSKFDAYSAAHPELAAEYSRRMSGELSADFAAQADSFIEQCQANMDKIASRKASQNSIENLGSVIPEFLGGSADLAGSNLTLWSGSKEITPEDASGNYLNYGVREFGMTAIMNGIALHGGFIPYGGTFLIFMEYARNAVRMAALMNQRAVYVFTHDSIGLGEDGPTHQPVEQLSILRATPGIESWRPCDTVETAVAWREAVKNENNPTALILSRQGLPCQSRSAEQLEQISKGGYILSDSQETPEVILIATGSEVALALHAKAALADQGTHARVVSMPCPERFMDQDADYRESVLPSDIASRVAIEAGHKDFWYKFVGFDGRIVGMDSFGASAPGGELMELYGFTVDNVLAAVAEILD